MEHRPNPIPIICDRCRARGHSGEDPFAAFGTLLAFEPVPRFRARADGWDAEVQRAYVAALSLTGSDRAACRAVGKSTFGITQLLAHAGAEGFRAAREEALAIAAGERSRRLAEGLRTVAAEQAGWQPPEPPWARAATRAATRNLPLLPPPAPHESEPELDSETAALAERLREIPPAMLSEEALNLELVHKYQLKLKSERVARLAGRIAEADFYVRQLTCLEVALDVVTGDAFERLKEARRGDWNLLAIAETDASKALDEARRKHWEACGDPPRPEHPPRHLLEQHDGFATEALPVIWGGTPEHRAEQERDQREQCARDAEAQILWEAEARRDFEARRARDAEQSAPAFAGEGDHPKDGGGGSADAALQTERREK